jgi:hypothetical protein
VPGASGAVELTAQVRFDLPVQLPDTLGVLRAVAYDVFGNVSSPVTASLRIRDVALPAVSVAVRPEIPGTGDAVRFEVRASDNLSVRWAGVRVFAPDSTILFADSVEATPPTATLNRDFTWGVPAGLTPGAGYRVLPFARDGSGNASGGGAIPLTVVDRILPTVVLLAPRADMWTKGGDSLSIQVRAQDNIGLRRVVLEGFTVQGDPSMGTAQEVHRFTPQAVDLSGSPRDVILTRILRFDSASVRSRPPASEAEPITLRVTATDLSGGVTVQTQRMTLEYDLTRPRVQILNLPREGTLDPARLPPVEVRVSDSIGRVPSGVVFLSLEVKQIIGNAVTGSIQSVDLATALHFPPFDPPAVESRTRVGTLTGVRATTAPDGSYFVIASARDGAGNLAADTVRLVSSGSAPVPRR